MTAVDQDSAEISAGFFSCASLGFTGAFMLAARPRAHMQVGVAERREEKCCEIMRTVVVVVVVVVMVSWCSSVHGQCRAMFV